MMPSGIPSAFHPTPLRATTAMTDLLARRATEVTPFPDDFWGREDLQPGGLTADPRAGCLPSYLVVTPFPFVSYGVRPHVSDGTAGPAPGPPRDASGRAAGRAGGRKRR